MPGALDANGSSFATVPGAAFANGSALPDGVGEPDANGSELENGVDEPNGSFAAEGPGRSSPNGLDNNELAENGSAAGAFATGAGEAKDRWTERPKRRDQRNFHKIRTKFGRSKRMRRPRSFRRNRCGLANDRSNRFRLWRRRHHRLEYLLEIRHFRTGGTALGFQSASAKSSSEIICCRKANSIGTDNAFRKK